MAKWKFLTNHARVLVLIAGEPGIRLRDIAWRTGLTEQSAYTMVSDLCADGYLTKHRVGNRNFYELHPALPLRGSENGHQVGELLRLLLDDRTAYPEASS